MTNTVTLIADHLGSTRPRVQGTEYIVDAVIDGLNKNQKSAIYYKFLGGKKPMFYEKNLDLALDNLLTITGKRIYA